MARRCVFCGDVARSKEHVWPRWVSRLFPDGQFTMEFMWPVDSPKTRVNTEIDVQVKQVCGACNNGWMSDIETAAQTVLAPMMTRRKPVSLSPEDQTIVATWATKMALVLPYADPNTPNPYAAEDRALFRTTRAPLPGSLVWLAGYAGGRRGVQSWFRCPAAEVPARVVPHSVTLSLGFLALQLLGGVDHVKVQDGHWSPASVAIWPSVGTATWPPRYGLDDAGFEALKCRWDDLVTAAAAAA